jgi:hypothetical protein
MRKYLGTTTVLAIFLSIGCGDGLNLGTVRGTVTKGGQPQSKLWVRFDSAEGGRPAEAVTNNQGQYELAYTGKKKGAPVGQHRVTLMSGGEIDGRGNELTPRKELFRGEVEVKSGSNTLDFELD